MAYGQEERKGFWTKKKIIWMSISGALLIVALCTCPFSCVPAGHVGVIDVFGSVSTRVLPQGFNFPVNPLAKVVAIPIRMLELKETKEVNTKEGLNVGLDFSVWHETDPDAVANIYNKYGKNYVDSVLLPAVCGILRDAISSYSCEGLYDPEIRQKAADNARKLLNDELKPRGITVDRVFLRNIVFPPQVKAAIDAKMAAKQQAEQMEFTIQKEQKEAERKAIEAGGLAKAQSIIAQSLTVEYLQWKYVETLKSLADSPNNTFVIAPFDEKLVPLLNVQAGPHQPVPHKAEK